MSPPSQVGRGEAPTPRECERRLPAGLPRLNTLLPYGRFAHAPTVTDGSRGVLPASCSGYDSDGADATVDSLWTARYRGYALARPTTACTPPLGQPRCAVAHSPLDNRDARLPTLPTSPTPPDSPSRTKTQPAGVAVATIRRSGVAIATIRRRFRDAPNHQPKNRRSGP